MRLKGYVPERNANNQKGIEMGEISVERKKLYHGIFTTALEGGIGYWSVTSEYSWSKAGDGAVTGVKVPEDDLDGFYAVIEPSDGQWGVFADDHAKDRGPLRIDLSVIQAGMVRFREWVDGDKRNEMGSPIRPDSKRDYLRSAYAPRNDYWKEFAREERQNNWDAVDYDAGLADVIVQLGLFDEVVYG